MEIWKCLQINWRLMAVSHVWLLAGITSSLAVDAVSTFSSLPRGDELHIRYVTQGCFHRRTTNFRFTANPEPKMIVLRTESRLRDDAPDFERITTGTLTFRPDEIAGLDRLLGIYRTPATFGSTTQHEVKIVQLRGGQVIATEVYKHVGPPRGAKEIPTFDKLSRDIGEDLLRALHSAELIASRLSVKAIALKELRLLIDTRPGDLSPIDPSGKRFRLIQEGEFCPGTRYRATKVERRSAVTPAGVDTPVHTITVRHEDTGEIEVIHTDKKSQPWKESVVVFRDSKDGRTYQVKMGDSFTVQQTLVPFRLTAIREDAGKSVGVIEDTRTHEEFRIKPQATTP